MRYLRSHHNVFKEKEGARYKAYLAYIAKCKLRNSNLVVGIVILLILISFIIFQEKDQRNERIEKIREHSIFYQDTILETEEADSIQILADIDKIGEKKSNKHIIFKIY